MYGYPDERNDLASDMELRNAIEQANIPVLLMVLVHLTGEDRWLQPPFRPKRGRGMDDNDTGRLANDVQRQIRDAAVLAVARSWSGDPPRLAAPDAERLRLMFEACTGEEDIPPAFAEMMAEEMGFRRRWLPVVRQTGAAPSVVIVGAGVSGLALGKLLHDAGVPYVILEKSGEIGGTWATNDYPGCGVDTPSHLYSLSFAPHAWPSYFARREELKRYLQDVARSFGIDRRIRTRREVVSAAFDETAQHWSVRTDTAQGETDEIRAPFLVSAVGHLNRPKMPDIPGLREFPGPSFHSACWPSGFDAAGKRIAVVGTGASAMQIVPAVVDRAAGVTIFQRSPQWVAYDANYFRPISAEVQFLFDRVPYYQRWYRAKLAWTYSDRIHHALQIDEDWPHLDRSVSAANDQHREVLTTYMEEQLAGRPDLLAAALPDYPPFGKRMLLDNGWFAALKRDHVRLVTSPVTRVTRRGLQTADGARHPADCIVFATGFEASNFLAPMRITGRNGTDLRSMWGPDDGRAHLGMNVPGFPNLFLMYGPNTNLGHGGSFIWIAEAQARYITKLVVTALNRGWGTVECAPEAYASYNDAVDARHERMIWTHPGMSTWYRNGAGRVVSTMPWRVMDYWHMVHDPDPADFSITDHATWDRVRC